MKDQRAESFKVRPGRAGGKRKSEACMATNREILWMVRALIASIEAEFVDTGHSV